MSLNVVSEFLPKGDQPEVINSVCKIFENAKQWRSKIPAQSKFPNNLSCTIKGATGTGKTYVMAKIIERLQRPALILAHNKTLAAQLYREFQSFFPKSAVEYFVSYYDYYQPEAYVAKRDLYIEKDSSINDDIDRLRLKATASLVEREDVVIVSSVSCIYGLGSPEHYKKMYIHMQQGMNLDREELLRRLVEIQYQRNDDVLKRSSFRVRGEIIEIAPAYFDNVGYRIEFFGDEVEALYKIDLIGRQKLETLEQLTLFPAKHFIMPEASMKPALVAIEAELKNRLKEFEEQEKLLERERLRSRTLYDLEMLHALGSCSGIENYSRHLAGRAAGTPPLTLIDYFPKNFLVFVDESHVTLPQIRAMSVGDMARKESLVEYGFRLPSARDNRPLQFSEFMERAQDTIFVSATPSHFEEENAVASYSLINRPTGLLDPKVQIFPSEGQIDHLLGEIRATVTAGFRILITTLTKKMSEMLSAHLKEHRVKACYMHSDIDTIERVEILRDLRQGKYDVLVGINLLREGLDLPEVALVAILDADKIGFLRSATSLIQTIGRAARNSRGRVLMYADKISTAMQEALDETTKRRSIQKAYNKQHGIRPTTIQKPISDLLQRYAKPGEQVASGKDKDDRQQTPKTKTDVKKLIRKIDLEMRMAADSMEYEKAIALRDKIRLLEAKLKIS